MNTTDRLDRRDLLKTAGQLGAGLIGAGALAAVAATPVAADIEDTQHGIVGAWIDDVTPNGTGAPHQVITLYTPGGGVTGVGNGDGRSLIGVWARTDDREFAITFLTYAFTPQGSLAGTVKVRIAATLGPGNDRMEGRALVAFSPAGSTTFFPNGTTTFTARRVKVEPI